MKYSRDFQYLLKNHLESAEFDLLLEMVFFFAANRVS